MLRSGGSSRIRKETTYLFAADRHFWGLFQVKYLLSILPADAVLDR
jgi:hypothetical protein